MSGPDPTDHVRALVEILDGRLAHHREATLQLGQIFPAEDFVGRSRATRHNAGILSDSLFIRLRATLGKTVEMTLEWRLKPRWAIRESISDQETRRSVI